MKCARESDDLDENIGSTNTHLRNHITTIDEIEQLTGIDFFPELPEARESVVEAFQAAGFVEYNSNNIATNWNSLSNPQARKNSVFLIARSGYSFSVSGSIVESLGSVLLLAEVVQSSALRP